MLYVQTFRDPPLCWKFQVLLLLLHAKHLVPSAGLAPAFPDIPSLRIRRSSWATFQLDVILVRPSRPIPFLTKRCAIFVAYTLRARTAAVNLLIIDDEGVPSWPRVVKKSCSSPCTAPAARRTSCRVDASTICLLQAVTMSVSPHQNVFVPAVTTSLYPTNCARDRNLVLHLDLVDFQQYTERRIWLLTRHVRHLVFSCLCWVDSKSLMISNSGKGSNPSSGAS